MFCVGCGAQNPAYAQYCHRCGDSLVSNSNASDREADLLIEIGPVRIYNPFAYLTAKRTALAEKRRRDRIAEVERYQSEIQDLAEIPQREGQCHNCGNANLAELRRFRFGLAKILSTKRNWLPTLGSVASSAAVAAIALPLLGRTLVRVETPGTKRTALVLRLKLVLCAQCFRDGKLILRAKGLQTLYSLHPWWDKARAWGYTEFLTEEELEEWKAVQ